MANQENQVVIESQPLPTTKATSPFDRDDADLILRTSDRVDFLVHRPILAIASPFFESMLSLPQPPTDLGQASVKPVIDVSEDGCTMEAFLRAIYPTVDPDVQELSLLRNVLDAGVKYEAVVVITVMRRAMVSPRLLKTKPLAVFAIACRHQLEDEAKTAAQHLVEVDSSLQRHGDPLLDELSAGQYYRLLQFERYYITPSNFCRPPSNPSSPSTEDAAIDVTSPFAGPGGDLILKSCDSRMFYVHRAIIALASPAMLDDILIADNTDSATIPVYPMQENSVCVDILLRHCYPIAKPECPSALTYRAVLVAARKYRLPEVEKVARTYWPRFAESPILSFYFLAAELGWKEEAVACARRLALLSPVPTGALLSLRITSRPQKKKVKPSKKTISLCPSAYTSYIPSMESTSSVPYRNLLSYVDDNGKAVTSTMFRLSDLPIRGHNAIQTSLPTDSELSPPDCSLRYPSSISTDAPPAWLRDKFTEIKCALERCPSSDVLAIDTPLWYSFIAFVANDKPPCGNQSCKTSIVEWATKVLQRYAEAVDQAILKVELKMTAEGTCQFPTK